MAIFQNLGPEGARIGELAERAKLTNQLVGYLVDYLEEHGYVERRPRPCQQALHPGVLLRAGMG